MSRKLKLANLILIESASLNEMDASNFSVKNAISLASELAKDAIELAKIVTMEERMRKVIDIMTREPLEVLPFDKEQSEEILAYLLNFKINDPNVSFAERYTINQIVSFIENNSGASAMEVMERKKA